jgi:hypothetical protein
MGDDPTSAPVFEVAFGRDAGVDPPSDQHGIDGLGLGLRMLGIGLRLHQRRSDRAAAG